jgi:hypothetical protein
MRPLRRKALGAHYVLKALAFAGAVILGSILAFKFGKLLYETSPFA